MKPFVRGTAVLLAFALGGCGGSELVGVSGVVTMDGQPYPNAAVMFNPVDGGTVATGETDSSGRFKMGTRAPGDGVKPGKYKVTILPVDKDAPRFGHPSDAFNKKPAVDPGKKTDANAEARKVLADQAKQVKKLPPPGVYGDPEKTPLTVDVPAQTDLKLEMSSSTK